MEFMIKYTEFKEYKYVVNELRSDDDRFRFLVLYPLLSYSSYLLSACIIKRRPNPSSVEIVQKGRIWCEAPLLI